MLRGSLLTVCCFVACGARSELDGRSDASAVADAGNDIVVADVPHEPCTPRVLLDKVTVTSLWLDGDGVYFASQSRGIGRVPKSGGPTTTYSTVATSYHVTTDDAYVYWTADECAVARKAKDGTSAGEMLSCTGDLAMGGLALDATNVYFVDRTSSLWRIPKTGGESTKLANLGMGPMDVVLVDGSLYTTLYWPPGGIVRTSIDGTGMTLIAKADYSMRVVSDGTSLYWLTVDSVLESRLDGSGLVVHESGGEPQDIAFDEANIYWTDIYGKIFTAPKGSSVSTSVDVGDILRNIAVDDQCIYYTTNCCAFTDGQILQRPK